MAITKITRDALNTGIDDNSDATAITIGSDERVGVGAAPNATFGSLLYTQGTPAANKPIISGYSQGNSNNAGLALFNDAGNRGIWTNGSSMRFTRTYEGNSTADMTIDVSGRVTKPSQPGFYARRTTGGDGRPTGVITEWHISGTGTFNTGNHFNTSTGTFTAPVAGRYLFCAAPGYKQTNHDFNFYFQVNSGDASEPVRFIGTPPNSHSLATGTVIYNLSANDTVRIRMLSTHHVNTNLNFFMGYLLG